MENKIIRPKLNLDSNQLYILSLKSLSKEEFINKTNDEALWDSLQKAKIGFISISKLSGKNNDYLSKPYIGSTVAFGENLSCYINLGDGFFRTSTIQSIDWNKQEFKTLNSIYKFNFEDIND